jgi:PAT family beta-lactamase induction signal transducer AmpG
MGLAGLPSTFKFVWAPLLDRYVPPFLGRRRGWLVISQVLLLIATAAMALHDPRRGLQLLAVNAVLIAFFSASQDIVGDAYRTDVLTEREMGPGASVWVLGYRIAMLVTASLAFFLAERQRGGVGQVFASRKMAVLLLLGFSSGLPLYFTDKMLQAWMTVEGVKIATIGAFGLVGLPSTFKFVWAPLLDRYVPPFLGRRRGWLVVTQLLLMLATAAMALHDPRRGLQLLAVNAVLIAFFSASQDIVGDAYRTDVLAEREMGPGASIWVLGYRIAMLVTASLSFFLAERLSWPAVYVIMSLLMLVGVGASFAAPEPVLRDRPPQSLAEAVWYPFQEFFQRAGVVRALVVLLFVMLYKLADNLALGMATPFLLKNGVTQAQLGAVGGVALVATIGGTVLGGAIVGWLGINRSLWVIGVLQALSQLGYYALARFGASWPLLVAATIAENVVYGMVGAAFIAFLMSICSRRFSATQYALLSSLMAFSRVWALVPAGYLAERVGWPTFFLLAMASGILPLLLLPFFAPWSREVPTIAAAHPGAVEEGEG